ncbi:MAG: isoleucine--tRNA ligase [Thermoflavifilum sp.]|nr:isoleucine--tRNA ligase [Thermoflavifilum sp.]
MDTAKRYPEYTQLNLPAFEREILQQWEQEKTFEQSVMQREGRPAFVFYEGPPSANGLPGIHHVISRTLKDLVCRYRTMKGFQVKRKSGWDTHGLPVELGVEQELGISKADIGKKISVAEYNRRCREAVLRYKDKWEQLTRQMGYWVDLEHPYITFDNTYIETLWWLLKKLYEKGLLYESISIQPYSPAAGTGLSSHELNQPGTYKLVKDASVVAMFRINSQDERNLSHPAWQQIMQAITTYREQHQVNFPLEQEQVFCLAWTTTPWTLPANLGLTVGPDFTYSVIRTRHPYTQEIIHVILAKEKIGEYFATPDSETIESSPLVLDNHRKIKSPWVELLTLKGQTLQGLYYKQLMPFEANRPEHIEGDPFRIVTGDFVTTEEGTGIVHTAPAFGADDFRVGKQYGLGILILVDKEGKFIDGLGEFSGRYVKNYKDDPHYQDVNVDLCNWLKVRGLAFRIEKYEHNYPHCWRTDKPVLYYPLQAWFIRTTAFRDRMVALNKQIRWKPASTGEGRFGNWLENIVDWNLSRSRFWGTPLPIWRTADGTEEKCIGSIAELKTELQKAAAFNKAEYLQPDAVFDLHKPDVDEMVLLSDSGKPMYRVPDLVDVWFDSGAMPFAQWHFPFEQVDTFAQNYPADFICEGVDQTRGWFYTLHAISALLKEEIQEELRRQGFSADDTRYPGLAFKTVVSNGLVLDKHGNKMSKRLGNVVDPFDTIRTYGADATRWYLITNASPWENLRFDVEGIREAQRKFFGTLYNTYQFFALYANIDGFTYSSQPVPIHERPIIDQWVISALNTLVSRVNEAFDDYEPTLAGRYIEDFVIEQLSNWYVRLNRRRFWSPLRLSDNGQLSDARDKESAYQTLYECLETISLLMAPIAPFFADWLFRNLNAVTKRLQVSSVHLADFPQPNSTLSQPELEAQMQLAQDITSLILSLRKKVNIKVRQPLRKVLIPVVNEQMKNRLQAVEELIKAEVNVKAVEYVTEAGIRYRVKPNFKALGSKLGKKMKVVNEYLQTIEQPAILALKQGQPLELKFVGERMAQPGETPETTVQILPEEVEIFPEDIPGWITANKGNLTVALDITVTPELENEGHARELVNRIQRLRKESGLEVTDRIHVQIADHALIRPVINDSYLYKYICTEILADQLDLVPQIQNGSTIEVDEVPLTVHIQKTR